MSTPSLALSFELQALPRMMNSSDWCVWRVSRTRGQEQFMFHSVRNDRMSKMLTDPSPLKSLPGP